MAGSYNQDCSNNVVLSMTRTASIVSPHHPLPHSQPVTVTSVTLQETCRSMRDMFFTDWSARNEWSTCFNTSLAGRFKCIATECRIEFGHTRFRDLNALRASVMAFYALARNRGKKDHDWEDGLRKLAGKASFLGCQHLSTYMIELADYVRNCKLPAIYMDPFDPDMTLNIQSIDLCFLSWPLVFYDAPHNNQESHKVLNRLDVPAIHNRYLYQQAS